MFGTCLFDARQALSAPITAFTQHFGWLVREAEVTARALPDHLDGLRTAVAPP